MLPVKLFLLCLEFFFGWDRERLVERIDIFELECTGERAPGIEAGGQALLDTLDRAHAQSRNRRQLFL